MEDNNEVEGQEETEDNGSCDRKILIAFVISMTLSVWMLFVTAVNYDTNKALLNRLITYEELVIQSSDLVNEQDNRMVRMHAEIDELRAIVEKKIKQPELVLPAPAKVEILPDLSSDEDNSQSIDPLPVRPQNR